MSETNTLPTRASDPALVLGIAKATGIIALVTIVARIAGFVRYLVFGAAVGAGDVGTAYASANLIPSVMFEVAAGGALATMVIPLVAGMPLRYVASGANGSGAERADSGVGANRVVSVILVWSLVLTTALAAVLFAFSESIATVVFAPGQAATTGTMIVGTRMLRVFAFQLPLYALTIVCGAFLQSRKRFFWPAVAPLVSSLVVMVSYGVYSVLAPPAVSVNTLPASAEAVLAWGTTGGVGAMAACTVIPALRAGFRPQIAWRLPQSTARKAWGLAGAGVIAVTAQQLTLAVILVLAARAGGTGTLPLFQYAQAVYLLPFAILLVPVMTSVFPHLSELRLVGEETAFSRLARGSMQTVMSLAAVGGAAVWGASTAIEAFFRGIDRTAVAGVGSATAALSLGLIGYAAVTHATRILNAHMRPADALIVGSIPWGIAAILICVTVLTSPSRQTQDAATLFGLCIAAGMTVGGVVALGLVQERSLTVDDAAALRTGVAVAVGASAIASIATFALSRQLVFLMAGPWASMGIGVLLGVLGGGLCLGLIALADRDQARAVTARVVDTVRKFKR